VLNHNFNLNLNWNSSRKIVFAKKNNKSYLHFFLASITPPAGCHTHTDDEIQLQLACWLAG
jgi:hypothetical protein